MKIALIGYGKMGKEIEKIALERNHTINLIVDIENPGDLNKKNLANVDVAIDFSTPATAYKNILKCFEANTPIVCGTTGWLEKFDEGVDICKKETQSFFYGSNFSLGVNIFFKLNKYLAAIMNKFPNYKIEMEEIHHVHKKDAPSGTAISLANDILQHIDRKIKWELNTLTSDENIKIKAVREDEVPGTHHVFYESPVDILQISHISKNRKGLALGAVLAAEFIKDKKGYFTMNDLLNF